MHVLIPCKSLDTGKSRLAECLDAAARRALCEHLLRQSLTCATAVVAPARIRIVTSDRKAAEIAARYDIPSLSDPGGGLNVALELGRGTLIAERADAILIWPIDLPFATPEAITKTTAFAGDAVIGPDESGTGTNLLLLRGAALQRLPFCFGPGSYAAHLTAAQASDLTIKTITDPRIAFDLDDPAQYATWRQRVARPNADAAPASHAS
jgi:2-phospho-L-lactate guanylyltransferase